MNFVVELYPNQIIIVFPYEPTRDEKGMKIIALLDKADFERQPKCRWVRDRTDFWVEQCKKLAAKCGASVVDTPNIIPEAPNIIPEAPNITEMQEMRQEMRQQMAAMQAEIVKLKQEVEELKKLDAIG